jgi:NADH dehydrogenase FAD-containing subunit
MAAARPKVVIIGASFGGLTVAQSLRHAPVDVTVIDRHNFHYFQPLLYQVATATLSPADIAWPIRGILRRQKNTTVLMANVTGVDTAAQLVHAGAVTIPYDYLVLATGDLSQTQCILAYTCRLPLTGWHKINDLAPWPRCKRALKNASTSNLRQIRHVSLFLD